ncbi:hypothetical protein AURDEDRAFT_179912 [Auricularia subglabra TFB-10046 SS5]|nr:hypothetical protein AURDEDRAFT_179912 [Auricularia subglabra TFB-10046 SS5]
MYHCRGGLADLGEPRELIPSSQPRTPSDNWPSPPRTCAFDQRAGHYVASLSENASIPQLPPEEYPRVRVDYRLGPHDPTLYPQIWEPTVPHLAWIERHDLHRELHKGHITAYVFQPHDWEPISEGAPYGRISSDLLSRLEESFYDIHLRVLPLLSRARTRLLLPTSTIRECTCLLSDLRSLTSTFRESARLTTRIQRGIAELLAFRLFRLDVEHHVPDQQFVSDRMFNYIGVFTADDAIVNLFHRLGVPVFLLLRGLPRTISPVSVVQPVAWNSVVETSCLESLEKEVVHLADCTTSGRNFSTPGLLGSEAPAHVTPAARSGRRRSPSPPRRGHGNTLSQGAYQRDSSRRSCSPARLSQSGTSRPEIPSHPRSPERISQHPRYIPHERPRIKEVKKRQHPDAPEHWRPRSWATDPGNQTSLDFKLPEWSPKLPPWLVTVASSVDRSVTREWRLSAPDTPHAVPQEIFTQPLEYILPPIHLLLKHEKRFLYVIKSWLALRDFWLRRIMEDGSCSLNAGTWRRVLDDKYHTTKELALWIELQSARRSAEKGDDSVLVPERMSLSQRGDAQQRISSLSAKLRDELTHRQTSRVGDSVTGGYSRAREPGEDLPAPSSRDVVEPEAWKTQVPGLDVFFEARPRCMVLMDQATYTTISSEPTQYHEYWDYEAGRVLLFDRASRVPDEESAVEEGEILLRDAILTWHRSLDDESGVCAPSRAMWKATASLVTDDVGKVVVSSAPKSTEPVPPVNRIDEERRAPAATTGLELSQGGRPLVAPPADPVYGYHPELPNGHRTTRFVVRNQVLTPDDLDRPEVRAFLIWELEEAGFRFELRRTDTWVLRSMGLWSREVQTQREALIQRCWGGNDGFVPSGMGVPALTDTDPRKRVAATRNFWELVRAWPRAREVAQLRAFTGYEDLSHDHFLQLEREIWKFYAQTFYDYFGILPTLPKLMPPNPFIDPENQ